MMTVRYSVSFEFEVRPPTTHRGTIAASTVATCVSRATREAQRVLRPVKWTSMVVVLLERLSGDKDKEELEAEQEIDAKTVA